ncbi:FAD-dependent urate hydroxylase [Halomonadaceae bacterium LMG 33818]|uniref:NAD(P)-binding domain-containing protein n=1 Tax=Cernens ardua TaxID=3402176 RepID=UPI003EDC67E7
MTDTHPLPTPDNDPAVSLDELVSDQLSLLNYPPANWVPEKTLASGEKLVDVTIIGAGQCGLAAAFSLKRKGISNIRILDRHPEGIAGPWLNFARMETLRSPTHLLGPACDIPGLTFQAWFRYHYGSEAFDNMERIPRTQWQTYLEWYRHVLGLRVEFDTSVTRIAPADKGLRVSIHSPDGHESFATRKVVLATGMSGLGTTRIPDFLDHLSKHYWAHSSGDIDFNALKGKKVVVVGMGSSAMDNAAEALEHGAKEVHLLARRQTMPTINKLMGIGSPGFIDGYPDLSPDWRWRIMSYADNAQVPPPHGSTLRVSRHANAFFHFNAAIESVDETSEGLSIMTASGKYDEADFIIAATGFKTDVTAPTELSELSPFIALWKDRYTPPEGLENEALSSSPWLGKGFQFIERDEGELPALKNVHAFNAAASLSLGKVSGDIPSVSVGAGWLARCIASDLYNDDIEEHWQALLDYSKPELDGSEWRDADSR